MESGKLRWSIRTDREEKAPVCSSVDLQQTASFAPSVTQTLSFSLLLARMLAVRLSDLKQQCISYKVASIKYRKVTVGLLHAQKISLWH